MRLIGDVHGQYDIYHSLATGQMVDQSIQIGDFGFSKAFDALLASDLDPKKHKVLFGNHDDYSYFEKVPHNLGHFGHFEYGGKTIFFIRGAYSIDKAYRIPGISWWDEEQLSYESFSVILGCIGKVKPDIIISHDCPKDISDKMFLNKIDEKIPNLTSTGLQEVFEICQPKYWYFGHWHKTKKTEINGTTFQCIGEHDYIDI